MVDPKAAQKLLQTWDVNCGVGLSTAFERGGGWILTVVWPKTSVQHIHPLWSAQRGYWRVPLQGILSSYLVTSMSTLAATLRPEGASSVLLLESFAHVPREAGDIESEWDMYRTSIVKAADRCCGHKVVCACRCGNHPLVDNGSKRYCQAEN